jgi:uridine phosphorylase
VIDKVKTGLMNAALKFISIDEKIVMMYLETSSKNVKPIVILPAVKTTMKLVLGKLTDMKKHGYVYNGKLNGIEVSVIQTRIGGPQSANVMEALNRCGCKVAIRIDFCGGLKQKNIKMGDIIIPKRVFLSDGTAMLYIQKYLAKLKSNNELNEYSVLKNKEANVDNYLIYPNYLDKYYSIEGNKQLFDIFSKSKSMKINKTIKNGILWSQDAIFCEEEDAINTWLAYACNSVDMESSIIYLLGSIFNIPTISILTVSDQPDSVDYGLLKDKRIHPDVFPTLQNSVVHMMEKLPKIKETFINKEKK